LPANLASKMPSKARLVFKKLMRQLALRNLMQIAEERHSRRERYLS
jgi:hypothetical protein